MNNFFRTGVALLLAASAPTFAQSTQLAPQKARITDEAIQADHKAYETLQGRIKALNDGGRPVRDYHLGKAQCWLDVSFHEYTRNDRSAFTQDALSESEKLIVAMERDVSPLPNDTPLVNGAARLRPDLWERAAGLRSHEGFKCAQQKVACAEIELVHAGNEYNQQQWRHAKPYVQIAEDLLGEAKELADRCIAPPAAPPPAPRLVLVPALQQLMLMAEVLFNFDKFDAKNMRPFSVVQLEELVRKVKRENLTVLSIKLNGHADRLNNTGNGDYNQRLSEKRVATVRDALVAQGIDAQLITTAAKGDKQQIQGCEERFKGQVELRECLLPNRRVEVVIEAKQPAP
jgi:OmpA-OmpF porin, OOP family